MFGKTLVIAPHLDDETIALGGTIKKITKSKLEIHVLIIGGHLPPLYKKEDYIITKKESFRALRKLGVKNYHYLDLPATQFHKEHYQTMNNNMYKIIKKVNPKTVFIPFPDRHIDHRTVFDCAMVNTRPNTKKYPNYVLSYETLSETHWNAPYIEPNFVPNFFVNIDKTIESKLKALKFYKSQIKGNSSRSLSSVKALAKFRGSQNGCEYAEAFKLIRAIV
ncbi:PIG-L family deacetylase [Candidatus Pelagibacter sp.]|nr:PIG-L family deacetylase [Candidatus Pelagibacter sp.]